MILTERQKMLRQLFREAVIDLWKDPEKTLMFSVVNYVHSKCAGEKSEIKNELAAIPSIRLVKDTMPIHVWTAKHFKAVSNALFDGKDKQYVLSLWKSQKYSAGEPKWNAKDVAERGRDYWRIKKMKEIKKFKDSIVDPWDRTNWSKVK